MRINYTTMANLLQSAAALQTRQTQIAQQLSSGVRIAVASDDPIATGQGAGLSTTLSQADSFLASASTVRSRSQALDTALGGVVTQLTSAVSTAISGQNDTQNSANRSALAQQLSGIRDTVLSLANSSYGGTYLFGGSVTGTAPFTQAADGTVTYNGDQQTASIQLQNGSKLSTAVSGSAVFTNATASVFSALNAAITSLQAGNAPGAVADLRSALNNVTTQRSTLDANMSRLDAETAYTATQKTETAAQQSKLLASDPVSLATQLSAAQTQRSALLSTLSIVQKGSLFDYL